MCNHTSHHAWFQGDHEKLQTYFYVKLSHFPCMARRLATIFFYYGEVQILILLPGLFRINVTMDPCNVWLLWYHPWRDIWITWKHMARRMATKESYLVRHLETE